MFRLQMKIINVQANDYGDYICEGRNKLGVNEAIIRLYGKHKAYITCTGLPLPRI